MFKKYGVLVMENARKSGRFQLTACMVGLGILFSGPVGAINKPIGRVMMAQGSIELIHADGTRNVARGGTYFLSGDTFLTSSKSRAQLRFEDGTLISLRPKSEFKVNEYKYDPRNKDNNRSVFSLIKGGFSTVSGWLGKLKPEGYEVRTPVAIVGIRGTHYELVLDDGLAAAVWQGGINIRNKAAQLRLGYGASFNFAHVASFDQPPVGLLKPPASIHPQAANLYVGDRDETLQATNSDGTSSEGESGGGTLVGDGTTSNPTDPAGNDEGTVLVGASGTDPNGNPVDPIGDPLAGATYGPVNPVNVAGAVNRAYGVFVGSSNTPTAIGSAPGLTGGGGFIYDPNLVYDGTQGFVVTPGTAANAPLASYTANAAAINYGKWDTAGANKINVYTDPNDDAFLLYETQPMYWLTMTPTAVMPVTGNFNYNLFNFSGLGSGGTLTSTLFTTNVDFGTGKIAGSLNMNDGTNFWVTNFNGGISGADLQASLNASSTVNGVSANGFINGSFSGTNAAAFGAVYDFDGGGTYATGAFIAEQGASAPYLSAADNTELAGAQLAGYGTTAGATTTLKGAATDLSSSGANPILYDSAQSIVARPGMSTRSAATGYSGPGTSGGANIKWGIWNASAINPFDLHTNPTNIAVTTTEQNTLYWLTLNETVTMPLSGEFNYKLASLNGVGNGGALTASKFTGAVNFADASLTGAAELSDATNNWVTTYTGTLSGARFDATLDAGSQVNAVTAATGTLAGSFSGTNADTMAGMFNFSDGTGLYANGVFVLDNPTTPYLSTNDYADLAVANRTGIAIFGNPDFTAQKPLIGQTSADMSSTGAATNQLLYDSSRLTVMRSTASTTYSFQDKFTATGGAKDNSGNPLTNVDIQWGDWNSEVLLQTDPVDGSVQTAATMAGNFMSWINMTPTASMPTNGTVTYSISTQLSDGLAGANSLYGSGGGKSAITIYQFDATANFSASGGTIGGTIDLKDGTAGGGNLWAVAWSADIVGTTFNTKAVNGSLTDSGVAGNLVATDGFVVGGFSGTDGAGNPAAIGGAFHLQDSTSTEYVGGTFVMTQ